MISSRISEGTFRPPGNLFLRLIWRSFRPSVAWCFGVAKGAFWRLAAPPLVAAPAAAGAAAAGPAAAIALFFQNPEGTSSPGAACFWRSFRPSVAWCFGVAKGAFWRLAAPPPAVPPAACSSSRSSSSSSSRSSSSRPSRPSRSSRPSRPSSWTRFVFTRIQKGRQAPGHMFLEVVPSFSSMVFRCGEGCVLEACSTTSSSTTSSMQREQQQQQQAQQAQQLNSLCFY